eukprot:m.311523 g.311523  ORF g.311523 m.311523 type:complete len:1588 (-) comp15957_c0_seq1:484-5247(-)
MARVFTTAFRLGMIATLLIASACVVSGQYYHSMIDQSSTSSSVALHGNPWQEFHVSNTGKFGRLQVILRKLYYAFSMTIHIREGRGAGGRILASKTLSFPRDDSGAMLWRTYDFTPFLLYAGKTYSFHLATDNNIGAGYSSSDPYKGGVSGRYSTTDRYDDYAFRLFYVYDGCTEDLYTDATGTCVFLTECLAAQYASTPATATTDRVCSPCEEGTFANERNADQCQPHSICTSSQFQAGTPTLSSDRECTSITVCSDTQYELSAPTLTTDRICREKRVCSTTTEYIVTNGTTTTDRECAAATVCSDTEYETSPLRVDSDRTCAALVICQQGEQEDQAPTATSDRVCVGCPAETFKEQLGSAACLTCQECHDRTFESVPCTPTTDRQCEACLGTCPDGTFRAPTCTGQQIDCTECTISCEPGTAPEGNCDGTGFENPLTCAPCVGLCNTCYRPDPNSCKTCRFGASYVPEATTCVDDCGPGATSHLSNCTACHHTCAECFSIHENGCVACNNFAHTGETSIPVPTYLLPEINGTIGTCVSSCGPEKFGNVETGVCTDCNTCLPGTRQTRDCEGDLNRLCEPCPLGTFQDQDNMLHCNPVTSCGVGEQQESPPTPSTDRKCKPCPPNTFQSNSGELECLPVTVCDITREYASTVSTPSSDAVCSPLTQCNATEYVKVSKTYTSDRVCEPKSTCAPGTYQHVAATAVADTVCLSCDENSFQPLANTTSCLAATQCDLDAQYESVAMTPTTDRECVNMTVCEAEEWEEYLPTLTSDRGCSSAVQYCVEFADVEKQQCTRCERGYWLSSTSQCSACPTGNVCNGLTPTACPLGMYQPFVGDGNCTACEPGTSAGTIGSPACSLCVGETFQPFYGEAFCQRMQSGYYGISQEDLPGFIGEKQCEVGYACAGGVRELCQAGTYSASSGSTECLPCGPSGFSVVKGAKQCIPISEGFYGVGEGFKFTSSQACPEGHYCTGGVKKPCSVGTYQNEERQSRCLACDSSSFLDEEASAGPCLAIPEGFKGKGEMPYGDIEQCPPGSFCTQGKEHECDTGAFQPQRGQSSCRACLFNCPIGEVPSGRKCDAVTGETICVDATPPTIHLLGLPRLKHEAGTPYADPGAQCDDLKDGEFKANASTTITTKTAPDSTVVIVYTCTDSAGYTAQSKRTVLVQDTTAPVVTLLGVPHVRILQFDHFTDDGVLVEDRVDPSPSLVVGGDTFSSSDVGNFSITYTATDNTGNTAVAQRLVEIFDISLETDAQDAATAAYEAAIAESGDPQTARKAAVQAYYDAGGEYDAQAAASIAEDISQTSTVGKTTFTGIVIAVVLTCIIVVTIALLLTRRARNQKVQLYEHVQMSRYNQHIPLPAIPMAAQGDAQYYSAINTGDEVDYMEPSGKASTYITSDYVAPNSNGYVEPVRQSEQGDAGIMSGYVEPERDGGEGQPGMYASMDAGDATYASTDTDTSTYASTVPDFTYSTATTLTEALENAKATRSLWFQDQLGRAEVHSALATSKVGCFLVRGSSQANAHALSVKTKRKVWDGLINKRETGYQFNSRPRVFESIDELIAILYSPDGAAEYGVPVPLTSPLPLTDC